MGRMSVGSKIRAARKERGLSQQELGDAIGVGQSTISEIEAGKLNSWATHAAKICRALGKPRSYFDPEGEADFQGPSPTQPMGMRAVRRDIPVMGEVAAGIWREAFARELTEAEEWIPVDVIGYERASLYALRIVGRSMDLFYQPGRYVVVAPAAEAGVREGDHVIVQRHKADLIELTVKELGRVDGRIALIPHSTDSQYETMFLKGEGADQAAPRVIGVVIADYGRRERPSQMFQPDATDWAE